MHSSELMPGIPVSRRRRPGAERPNGGRLPNRTPSVPTRVPRNGDPDILEIPLIDPKDRDREAPLYAAAGFHKAVTTALNN